MSLTSPSCLERKMLLVNVNTNTRHTTSKHYSTQLQNQLLQLITLTVHQHKEPVSTEGHTQ